jgi:pyruvyltransferase
VAKPIQMYWWQSRRGGGIVNFGDAIAPLLVRMVAGREVIHASPRVAQLAGAGSVLGHVLDARWKRLLSPGPARITIWGSGSIAQADLRSAHWLRCAAVRGPLTRDALGLPASTPLGDPGILIARVVNAVVPKTHRWGIVPHYVDQDLPVVAALAQANPGAVIIDVTDPDPLKTARRIAGCEFIISSSLHGIIAADAFGVPNVVAAWSDQVQGGAWKYHDYASGMGRALDYPGPTGVLDLGSLEPSVGCADARTVTRVGDGLVDAFRALGL